MSIPNAAVWEIRPGAGSDNNGGFFVTGASGTDYSQQNSPQYTPTGLTSAGSGSTILYAGAAAVMVGNGCNVLSGTNVTPGLYEVQSVSVGVSITLDRNVCTGVAASVALNIGGANATLANPVASGSDVNTVYIKATGTITITSAITTTFALTFIGYTTTRGDGGQATITTSTNSIDMFALNNGNNPTSGTKFANLILTSTAGTPGDGIHETNGSIGPSVTISNCSLAGFSTGVIGDWQAPAGFAFVPLTLFNTEIKSCTSDGVYTTGPTQVIGCFIHGNGRDGIRVGSTTGGFTKPLFVSDTILYNNTGCGINNQNNQSQNNIYYGYLVVLNCAIVSNGSDGIQQTQESTGSYGLVLMSSIIYGNGAYGVHQGTSGQLLAIDRSNAYGANTTADTLNWTKGAGAVALSGSPFTNPSGNDFSLNSTAGAGAACKAVGFPGALQIGGTGYSDIGALQSQASGGTTVVVIAPTQNRILVNEGE